MCYTIVWGNERKMTMKRKAAIILSALILCFTSLITIGAEPAFASNSAGFVIDNYKVEAQVHDDNTLDITETIKVDFSEWKHGIYRNIGTRFTFNPKGIGEEDADYTYSCKIDNVEVNNEWEFGESSDYNECLVIGDPDYKVTGKQKYVISYTYAYPDDRIDDFDFFYHSILGSQWQVPINHFSFDVRFDKKLPKDSIKNLQVFSGQTGNRDNALNVKYKTGGNSISGSADNISPEEAITLFTVLPEGYFSNEMSTSPVLSIIGIIIAFAGAALILLGAMRSRRQKPVVTVEFNAPDNISPAEVGMIVDETADDKDLLSLIPWFAEKGYITLETVEIPKRKNKTKEVMVLTKIKDLPEDAPDYQKKLFEAFFDLSDQCTMDNLDDSFGEKFIEAKKSLSGLFSGNRELSTGQISALGYALLVTVGAGVFYAFSSTIALLENFVPGIFALAFLIVAFLACTVATTGKGKIVSIIISAVALLVEFGVMKLFCSGTDCQFSSALCMIVFVVSAAASILSARLIRPTEYKLSMMGRLIGLKEFIKTAEMDKLNALVKDNPDYFFDILPYAMAFDLEEKWSKCFDKIKINKPDWYRSSSYDTFNTVAFCSMMRSNINSPVSSAVSSASSSSGGGGGGFSGGGGGGGGGGSW